MAVSSVNIRDAAGANQTFATFQDANSAHHAWMIGGHLNSSNTIDLIRNNQDPTANTVTLTAANTVVVSADQTNFNHKGLVVFVNLTANSGIAQCNVAIQNKDPISSNYYTIFTGGNVGNTVNGNTQMIQIYPGMVATTNNFSGVLSRTFRLSVNASGNGANTLTGQVTYALIL